MGRKRPSKVGSPLPTHRDIAAALKRTQPNNALRRRYSARSAETRPLSNPQLGSVVSLLHFGLSPSRKAIASSSTRTASAIGITGRASNTNAGNIEQNL